MVTGPSYLLLAALSVLFPFLFSFLCLPLFFETKKKENFFFLDLNSIRPCVYVWKLIGNNNTFFTFIFG